MYYDIYYAVLLETLIKEVEENRARQRLLDCCRGISCSVIFTDEILDS